jgi:hypothetical protein
VRRRTLAGIVSFALTLGCASCGGSSSLTSPSAARSPLGVSVSDSACPASPRLALGSQATLVPGHPTGALICRYTSPRKVGLPWTLAGALEVMRQDVTTHLASELNALPPFPENPAPSCPAELLRSRSDLIIFRYRGSADARVQITKAGCIPVTNGRIVRIGIGGLHMDSESHWPDEGRL